MSHSTISDLNTGPNKSSTDHKRKFPSSGTQSGLGGSNTESGVNGDRKRAFSFDAEPTSCLHSLSSSPSIHLRFSMATNTGASVASSSEQSVAEFKFRLNFEPTVGSATASVPAQLDAPSTNLKSGEFHSNKPFGSKDRPGSSTKDSKLGSESDKARVNFIVGRDVNSGKEVVRDDDGVFISVSSKPAFVGVSHEELRWQNYQHGYRGKGFEVTSSASNGFNQFPPMAFGQISTQFCPLFDQSNTIDITVSSFRFGQQSFTGQPFLLCLNNGPGFGFGQTFPCIIAFPQSTSSAFSTQSSALTPPEPMGFAGFKGTRFHALETEALP